MKVGDLKIDLDDVLAIADTGASLIIGETEVINKFYTTIGASVDGADAYVSWRLNFNNNKWLINF